MFTEVWLDNAINKIVHIPKYLVHVLKMKKKISVAKCSKRQSNSSPLANSRFGSRDNRSEAEGRNYVRGWDSV